MTGQKLANTTRSLVSIQSLTLNKIKNIFSLTLRLEFSLLNNIVELRIEPNIFVIYNLFYNMFVQ